MNPLENHGLIIRELRKIHGLDVRKAAQKINRSIGWLSEIENGAGTARLTEPEFERIVQALDGSRHKPMFRTWVANLKNQEKTDKTFDGAVLKFIRKKKGLSIQQAAKAARMSFGHLSKIENGTKEMTLPLRNRIMAAYGYSPSSFKNLSTDPIRSKAVPLEYKLRILLRLMSSEQLEKLFNFALSQKL